MICWVQCTLVVLLSTACFVSLADNTATEDVSRSRKWPEPPVLIRQRLVRHFRIPMKPVHGIIKVKTQRKPSKPSYGPPQQGYGLQNPRYKPTSQNYSPPNFSYGSPQNNYGTLTAPKINYGSSKPVKPKHVPGKETNGQSKPTYLTSKPIYGTPKPHHRPKKPEYGQPKPSSGTVKPSHTEVKPVQETTEPNFSDSPMTYGQFYYSLPASNHGVNLGSYTPQQNNHGQSSLQPQIIHNSYPAPSYSNLYGTPQPHTYSTSAPQSSNSYAVTESPNYYNGIQSSSLHQPSLSNSYSPSFNNPSSASNSYVVPADSYSTILIPGVSDSYNTDHQQSTHTIPITSGAYNGVFSYVRPSADTYGAHSSLYASVPTHNEPLTFDTKNKYSGSFKEPFESYKYASNQYDQSQKSQRTPINVFLNPDRSQNSDNSQSFKSYYNNQQVSHESRFSFTPINTISSKLYSQGTAYDTEGSASNAYDQVATENTADKSFSTSYSDWEKSVEKKMANLAKIIVV